jgi:hypothetical protein
MGDSIQENNRRTTERDPVKLSVHDLSPDSACCEACGRPFDPIEYVTALRGDSSTTQSGDSLVTSTYYRDFTRPRRRLLPRLRGKPATENQPDRPGLRNRRDGGGHPAGHFPEVGRGAVVLVVIGGIAMIGGLGSCAAALSLRKGSKDITDAVLYNYFLRRLSKDGLKQPELTYFSKEEAKSLIHMPGRSIL